jgi:hypothetical protein
MRLHDLAEMEHVRQRRLQQENSKPDSIEHATEGMGLFSVNVHETMALHKNRFALQNCYIYLCKRPILCLWYKLFLLHQVHLVECNRFLVSLDELDAGFPLLQVHLWYNQMSNTSL